MQFYAGNFMPSSPRQAKDDIKCIYFLYSADEEALRMENMYIKEKAKKNLRKMKMQKESRKLSRKTSFLRDQAQMEAGGIVDPKHFE